MEKNKYKLGEIVYLITDTEQLYRMVTGVKFALDGGVIYYLTSGTTETMHYEKEITRTRNIELALNLN